MKPPWLRMFWISYAVFCLKKNNHARWHEDHAGHLRLQLPGRSLRRVRLADQWESPHGVLRIGRSTRAANPYRADVEISNRARSRCRSAVHVRKPEAREG